MGSGQYRGTCGGVADKAMKLLLSLLERGDGKLVVGSPLHTAVLGSRRSSKSWASQLAKWMEHIVQTKTGSVLWARACV